MDAPEPRKEAKFALAVLRAIHSQYKVTTKLQLEYGLDLAWSNGTQYSKASTFKK